MARAQESRDIHPGVLIVRLGGFRSVKKNLD